MPSYFIRQNGAAVPQGPYSEDRIRAWVAESRVRVDMDFSEDGETWIPGRRLLSIFPPTSPAAIAEPPAERRAAARDAAERRSRRLNVVVACVGLAVLGGVAWYFLQDKERGQGAGADAKPVVPPTAATAAEA